MEGRDRQKPNSHYRSFQKPGIPETSEDYRSIPGLSQPHTWAVETLPQIIVKVGGLVFSTESTSENQLLVFQDTLFHLLASMRWEEWDNDDYTPRKLRFKHLNDNKDNFFLLLALFISSHLMCWDLSILFIISQIRK